MIEKIGQKVSVNFNYNAATGEAAPRLLKWHNALYRIEKIGLHYTLHRGSTLFHMFSACDANHYFLLSLDTKTLTWTLEEIADNQMN